MKPVEFPDQNFVYTAPEGQEENIQPLPSKNYIHPDLQCNAIDSVWELTDEELAEVNKTKRIRLTLCSPVCPPHLLQVEKPYELPTEHMGKAIPGIEQVED